MVKPNKCPKKHNAFFYFMTAKKRLHEAQGMSFPGGLNEVANFVSDEWKSMSMEEKKKYDRDGKMKPKNDYIPPRAENVLWEGKRKEELEHAFAMEVINLTQNEKIEDMKIILIEFNVWYFHKKSIFVPSEIGMLAFSLNDGVIDSYGTLIDPREVEAKMWDNVLKVVDELNLPLPPFDYSLDATNLQGLVNCIDRFINKYKDDLSPGHLFCRRHNMQTVNGCLQWLCKEAGTSLKFSVYPFDDLVIKLVEMRKRKKEAPILFSSDSSPSLTSIPDSLFMTPSVEPPGAGFEIVFRPIESPGISPIDIPYVIEKNQKSTEETLENSPEAKQEVEKSRISSLTEDYTKSSCSEFAEGELFTADDLRRWAVSSADSVWTLATCKQKLNITAEKVDLDEKYWDKRKCFNQNLREDDDENDDPTAKVMAVLDSVALFPKWQFSCFYHEQNDDVCYKCALSKAHHYAFNALRYLLPKFGRTPQLGVHYPTEDLAQVEWVMHKMTLKSWGLVQSIYPCPLYLTERNFKSEKDPKRALKIFRSFYRYQKKMKKLCNPKSSTSENRHRPTGY